MSPAAATRIGRAIVPNSSGAIQRRGGGYPVRVPEAETVFDALLETLKKVAGLLRDAEIPFLLGGGLAAWARGGPETGHDLDLMLREPDAERALGLPEQAGMRTE